MNWREHRVESVNLIEVPGAEQRPVIVMLHGYGANGYDLLPLCEQLQLPKDISWYFPEGIEEAPMGFGRAWFQMDIGYFQSLMVSGDYQQVMEALPLGLVEARERVGAMLQAIMAAKGIGPERLILGGFSQGAVVATDAALHLSAPIAALLIFSGILVAKEQWSRQAVEKSGIHFFQSHGTEDMVLAFQAAQPLEQLLQDCGWRGSLSAFQGGHEIPATILAEAESFLEANIERASIGGSLEEGIERESIEGESIERTPPP